MRRKDLKRVLEEIVEEYKKRPYEFWESADFPITFERKAQEKEIQIEIDILESTPDYLDIDFTASSGWYSSYCPVGIGILVKKPSGK